MSRYVLAIDAGTTGVTVLLFDRRATVVDRAYEEFRQIYPQPGWVEHDPSEIWAVTERLVRPVVQKAGAKSIAGIGITNQRETVVLWDRETGQPAHNAIVWQCRRTAKLCEELKASGKADLLKEKTGLVVDAYFSATKIQWLFENVPLVPKLSSEGKLAFGTIDSWLVWKLTGGRVHVTDYTNASRTLLLNIDERAWDSELLEIFGVPAEILPEVRPSSEIFGRTAAEVLGAEIPVAGIAGDQQAALLGQCGVNRGDAKNTYGTGGFLLVNTGEERVDSRSGLITTLACGPSGEPVYALEGSVFIAGAVLQWLRDELGVIKSAPESEACARRVVDTGGVYFVPAFVGLGAPYWNMDARGAIVGLTRGTNRDHIVRAALEAIAYQTRDLVNAVTEDLGATLSELRVDGGAAANDFLMQFQADLLGAKINRPRNVETTALGAAFLAGLAVGLWQDADELSQLRATDRVFEPQITEEQRGRLYKGWAAAVRRVI